MKQVFLSGKGEISVFDVPLPGRLPNSLLVRNLYSLISTGTESAAVSRRGGWLGVFEKACRSGDKVGKVWQLARTRGFQTAWETVRAKLDDHTAIGYSCCGQVVEVDGAPTACKPGDLVACMGTGLANHAEYAVVPMNLGAKVPEGVSPDEAAFAAIACIAQQGIRNLQLTPGESVVIIGLGLIGTLAAILAKAMGYTVFGVDLSTQRAALCQHQFGITCWDLQSDIRSAVRLATHGKGADGVILAAATKSSDPVNLAFDVCRARGTVSVVGAVGLDLRRDKMYRKEISLQVSCSYGPGRYDDEYELRGRDYPIAHARWTERRNLEYFLQLLADRRIDLRPLISRTYPIADGSAAYQLAKKADPGIYGVLFDYGTTADIPQPIPRDAYVLHTGIENQPIQQDRIRLGVIGCGGFAKGVHLPYLRRLRDRFEVAAIASRSGGSAAVVARRFRVPVAASDHRLLLDDPHINAVLICTRHASHAGLVIESLEAGKHVFVEKPLCLTVDEGMRIETLARERGLVVQVGFNRRFAPYLQQMSEAIGSAGQRILACRASIPDSCRSHWSNTIEEGGRFLGEGVHFLDLCNWFIGSAPSSLSAHYLGEPSSTNPNLVVAISYPDGSVCSVTYTSVGSPGIGKERYEALGNGRAAQCDSFRSLKIYGARERGKRRGRNDKGYLQQLQYFAATVRGESSAGCGADARAGTLATWMARAALQSAAERREVTLPLLTHQESIRDAA